MGYSYDNKFNLTGAESFSGTYDAANRLVSASNSGMAASPEVELVYDGLGRCVKRTIQGVATIIIYDEWKPIAEWDGWTEEYFQAWNVYGPGADELLLRQGGKWGYVRYHPDANGNIAFLLDNDGTVVEKYTYDVFGRPKITDRYGNLRASSHYDNRFLFQGREYIGEVGVYDYRNRFYHPSLGRFLQKDPTGFDAGDMNLFRYCGDDPVDGSDPTGLDQDQPKPVSRPLTSSGGGDWDWFNGRVGLDQMGHPAGIIMARVGYESEGEKAGSVDDVTINQLRNQLDASKDTTSQIVLTAEGPQVANTASQVKKPKGGRSSGTFGYEPVGEERMNLRSDATRTIHAHTNEGKKQAVPTGHDFDAVRESGTRPMYFSSRYLARHGKSPDGRKGNYIILRSTGSHHLDKPSEEYRFDPRLTMPPLR